MKKFLLLFLIFFALTTTSSKAEEIFTDIDQDHQYFEAIKYAKEEGIISGYNNGAFEPRHPVTRGELTKILVNSNFTTKEIDTCVRDDSPIQTTDIRVVFSDVTEATNSTFINYICVGKKHNLFSGYSDGTFRPNDLITNAEAIKIITNTFGYDLYEIPKDQQETDKFMPYVLPLEERNALPSTLLGLEFSAMNRADTVEIIWRLINSDKSKQSRSYDDLINDDQLMITILESMETKGYENCVTAEEIDSELVKIENSDSFSYFTSKDSGYYKSENGVYIECLRSYFFSAGSKSNLGGFSNKYHLIENADTDSFEYLIHDIKAEGGADGTISYNYFGKDKNHIYYNNSIIEEIPSDFTVDYYQPVLEYGPREYEYIGTYIAKSENVNYVYYIETNKSTGEITKIESMSEAPPSVKDPRDFEGL